MLHKIITNTLEEVVPEVGGGLIDLITTRQGVDDLLALDDVIDLVRLPLLRRIWTVHAF